MKLYQFNRYLESKGYRLLKVLPRKEIWTNGKKDLTFSVINDIVHPSVVKDIMSKL